MKKKIIILAVGILIVLIFVFFYLGKTAIVSTSGKTFSEKIARKIPEKTKTWIKKNFFKTEYLNLYIRNQNKLIDELLNKERKKNNIVIEKFKKIYFEKPYEIKTNNKNYKSIFFQTKFLANGKNDFAIASGYIDIFDDDLIIVTGDGLLFKTKLEELLNFEKGFYAEIIETNIRDLIKTPEFFKKSYFGIKDILIANNKIFLSFSNEIIKDCFNTGLLIADINLEFLNFQKHSLSETECAKKLEMDNALQGGRIINFSDNEIIITHGDWFQKNSAQNKESIFGKIIKYNFNNNKIDFVSYGHRNPQGLVYLKDKNILIETEHGPYGGDEVNIINLNDNTIEKNYGWPVASYGVGNQLNASVMFEKRKKYKSHEGFIEPVKYYIPSIGISEITKVPNKYFVNNNADFENFFIASLGTKISEGDLSLHRMKINKISNKIDFEDIIHIQERIRDIIYSENLNSLILFIESDRMHKGGPSIGIVKNVE